MTTCQVRAAEAHLIFLPKGDRNTMNNDSDHRPPAADHGLAADLELAQTTALALFERLKPDLGNAFAIVKGDPRWFDKHKPGFVRLRLQPVDPQPKDFWNKEWCMYAIKVGPWADIGAQLGAVMFGMYPNNARCGRGKYTAGVHRILHDLDPEFDTESALDRRRIVSPSGHPTSALHADRLKTGAGKVPDASRISPVRIDQFHPDAAFVSVCRRAD